MTEQISSQRVNDAIVKIRSFLSGEFVSSLTRGEKHFYPQEAWAPMTEACATIQINDHYLADRQQENLHLAIQDLQSNCNAVLDLFQTWANSDDKSQKREAEMLSKINIAIAKTQDEFTASAHRHAALSSQPKPHNDTSDVGSTTLEPIAPITVQNAKWLLVHGRKNIGILLVAVLIVATPTALFHFRDKLVDLCCKEEIGAFEISFSNDTAEEITVSSTAEYYITEPESPGLNRRVSSGLVSRKSGGLSLTIPPHETARVQAYFPNEQKIIEHTLAGDKFIEIIFSASPQPIRKEFLLNIELFSHGLIFEIRGVE